MRIAIGADHGGYLLKAAIGAHLKKLGHDVFDCGTNGPSSVDYPDFAAAVGGEVCGGRCDRGILVCGSGIGVSIAANKISGIRAALVHDVTTARLAAEHNDANVLCLGARLLAGALAVELVDTWLSTVFEARHQPRLDLIAVLESKGD